MTLDTGQKAPFNPIISIKQIAYFDDRFYKAILFDDSVRNLASVTTKLRVLPKPFLVRWRGDVGNETADRRMEVAADKGTRVHHACYMYSVNGGVIYNPPAYKGMREINAQAENVIAQFQKAGKSYVILQSQEEVMMVSRFRAWLSALNPTILGAEIVLYSLGLNTAGTADYVLQIPEGDYAVAGAKAIHLNGGIWLVDLKSGTEDPDHFVQLAAYIAMYEESTGTQVAGGMIVYLDADTKTGIVGLTTRVKTREEIMTRDFPLFQAASSIYDMKYGSQMPKDLEVPLLLYRGGDAPPVPNDFVQSNVAAPIQNMKGKIEPIPDKAPVAAAAKTDTSPEPKVPKARTPKATAPEKPGEQGKLL